MKIRNICFSFVLLLGIILLTSCSLFGNKDSSSKGKTDLASLKLGYDEDESIVYDGNPKEVIIRIRNIYNQTIDAIFPNVESNDFNVVYENNINAGVASVLVTAKESSLKYQGSNKLFFTIDQATTTSDNFKDLCNKAKSGNYSKIEMTDNIVVGENDEFEIVSSALVSTNGYQLTNYGTITNYGFLSIKNADGLIGFVNAGILVNEGSVVLSGAQMINTGTIDNNNRMESAGNYSYIYTNSDIDKLYSGKACTIYRRYDINEYSISIEADSFFYREEEIKPKVILEKDGEVLNNANYELIYSNNIEVGTASVKIIARETAQSLYGEKELYFQIEKSLCEAKSEGEFIDALDNPNYYGVSYSAKNLNNNFVIPEDKKVYLENVTLSGEVEVRGELIIDEGYVSITNELSISKDGVFTNNSKVYNEGKIQGSGNVFNNGEIYFFDNATSSIFFINEGNIYLNDDYFVNSSGSGDVINRIRIKEEDVRFKNNYSVYDGKSKYPLIEFLNDINPEPGAYHSQVYDKETNQRDSLVIDAGKYLYILNFFGYSKQYCGSIELDYEVLQAEIHVNTLNDFSKYIDDDNYNKVYVDKSLTIDFSITIPSYLEVVISEGVYVATSKNINLLGKITNNGNFAIIGNNNVIINTEGVFKNLGKSYFNDALPEGIIDDGLTYLRQSVDNAEILDFTEEVKYDYYSNFKPTFSIKLDGETLDSSNYSLSYQNCLYISDDDPALTIITADPFSELIYGKRQLEYRVLGGEIDVYSLKELMVACANVRPDTELCNWALINLKVDIKEAHPGIVHTTIKIYENTTLNLGDHMFWLDVNLGGRYIIVNDGIISITSNPYMSTVFYSGNGKIVGYASDADKLMTLVSLCDEVYLTNNIESSKAIEFSVGTGRNQDVNLNLNGFSILVPVIVDIYRASLVIENGTINSSLSISLYLEEEFKDHTLTLKNLTIYGINTVASEYATIIDCQIL